MEMLKHYAFAAYDEFTFWGEVLIEFLELDKNEYHYMIEAHQHQLEEEERERDIELRRDYYKNK